MLKMTLNDSRVVGLLFWLWMCAPSAFAVVEEAHYPSGLLQSFGRDESTDFREREEASLKAFFHKYFGSFTPDFEWRLKETFTDQTHVHRLFALHYRGRRVADTYLKTHFNRAGYLQYVENSWKHPFTDLILSAKTEENSARVKKLWRKKLTKTYRRAFQGNLTLEPVVWMEGDKGTPYRAFEIKLEWFEQGIIRSFYVEEESGDLLSEKKLIRFANTNNFVYKIDPDASAMSFEAIENLDDLTKLSNGYVRVRRDERTGTSNVYALRDVDPTLDYTNATVSKLPNFSTDPATYKGSTCSTTNDNEEPGTLCGNQSFDTVNVYYHLNKFRETLNGYLSTLGATSQTTSLLSDPLEVIVNSLSVDVNGDGSSSNDTDNAAYIPSTCRNGQSTSFARCLIFLRPSMINTSGCTRDGRRVPIQFYDLAREGNVIVHEFQHYITDRITGMVAGSSKSNVGDALHEGYSDYFGVSHVVGISGVSSATTVGSYAFQECPVIIRDLGTIRVYQNSTQEEDPHTSGLSWASGLWNLRTQMGREDADLLALKSLFFLSTHPSFVEAVEALVKADAAIFSGSHISAIRTLFYEDIKFVGGQSGLFRDPSKGILEMGLRGCLSVKGRAAVSGPVTLMLFLLWLWSTCFLGRKLGRP